MGMITYHGDGSEGRPAGLTINRLWMRVPQSSGKVHSGRMRIDPHDQDGFNDKRMDMILWFADEPVNEDTKPDVHSSLKVSEETFIRSVKTLRAEDPNVVTEGVVMSGICQFSGQTKAIRFRPNSGGVTITLDGKSITITKQHFEGGLKELFQRGELE